MVELNEGVFMMEIIAGGDLIGRTLYELKLPERYGAQVLLIMRDNGNIFPVSASDKVIEGDRIDIQVKSEALHKVARISELEHTRWTDR